MDVQPPNDLMEKLAKLQVEFPGGFIIFVPPQEEKTTWMGCFRFNPKRQPLIEIIYEKIVGGKMSGGSQN